MYTSVTTCVVVWIEIVQSNFCPHQGQVTTCVVVWIEIKAGPQFYFTMPSPPAWWCGLKSKVPSGQPMVRLSPPAWWCGLKFSTVWIKANQLKVTTCVVVWIEIISYARTLMNG